MLRSEDVSTAAFNQAVRRNRDRFPEDFMFQLTSAEVAELNRSQIVIGSEKHRDPRFRFNFRLQFGPCDLAHSKLWFATVFACFVSAAARSAGSTLFLGRLP